MLSLNITYTRNPIRTNLVTRSPYHMLVLLLEQQTIALEGHLILCSNYIYIYMNTYLQFYEITRVLSIHNIIC